MRNDPVAHAACGDCGDHGVCSAEEPEVRELGVQRNRDSGENYATPMTLVSTCDLNGVNPEEYLQDVLLRVRHATTPDPIADLLPHNWKPLAPAAWSSCGYQKSSTAKNP